MNRFNHFICKAKEYFKNNLHSYTMLIVMILCVIIQTDVCNYSIMHEHLWTWWTALFMSSIVMISRNRIWSWIVVLLYSIWCITLVIYYRANDLMFNVNAILMADNMHGFWTAVLAYIDWTTLVLVLMPIGYGNFLLLMPKSRKLLWKEYLGIIAVCLVSSIWTAVATFPANDFKGSKESIDFYLDNGDCDSAFGQDHIFGKFGERWFIPYHRSYFAATVQDVGYPQYHFQYHGAVHYLPVMIAYYLGDQSTEVLPVSTEELNKYWNPAVSVAKPKNNLIILLMESMETWPLELDAYSQEIAPNLCNWKLANHVTYVPHVYSQVRHGVSADGQMILNTGLLPISSGAACRLYPNNSYPNIASAYPYSVIVDPCSGTAWNQSQMNTAYGYQSHAYPTDTPWNDEDMFHAITNILDTIHEPFCIQGISIDSHTPFAMGRDYISNMPSGMPTYMHDYLGCYHITDERLGWLLNAIAQKVDMSRTVIVITADHSVFKSNLLESFNSYAQQNNLSIPTKRSACPLFIYIPDSPNQQINETAYQMDLFPTILSAIGIEQHPWRGFGIDLLDAQKRLNRDSVDESYYQAISNNIIINNSLIR